MINLGRGNFDGIPVCIADFFCIKTDELHVDPVHIGLQELKYANAQSGLFRLDLNI